MSKTKTNIIAGDFLIVSVVDKNYLVKVANFKDSTIVGDLSTLASDKVEPLSFFPEDVIANLGQNPKSGTAYGVKIEIFERYIETHFGKVAVFLKLDKKVRKEFIKHYNKAYKRLEDLGLLGFTYTLEHEIRNKQGKMAGCYNSAKNLDHNDKMTIFANSEIGDLTFEEVILHESGHGIWHRLIQKDSLKSKWVEDYSKFIEIESIRDKEVRKHLSALISTGDSFSQYKSLVKSQGEDFEILMLDAIIKYFKEARRLTIKDLDYVSLHDKDFLKQIWPSKAQEIAKIKKNPISEYAMKNVQEYFCECFRIHAIGKKLPKTTRKLMDKTLQASARIEKLK